MIDVNNPIDSAQLPPAARLNIIGDLAGRVATQAEQINHLAAVCIEAAQDIAVGGEAERASASTRLETLLVLAQSLARETADHGIEIERLAANARLAAA